MLRALTKSDLVGKKIVRTYIAACNCVILYFDDDTTAELWAEIAVCTFEDLIPGIMIEDLSNPER